MHVLLLKTLLIISTTVHFFYPPASAATDYTIPVTEKYKCLPCGNDCDNQVYSFPGKCPHCGMDLVKTSTITFKTIQPSEICDYIYRHPNVVLLDVRTRDEFDGKGESGFGTLKNAINVPIQELTTKLSMLEAYKNREVIVYCSHSHRSPQASYLLTQNGFTNVTNMAGGMSMVGNNPCKK